MKRMLRNPESGPKDYAALELFGVAYVVVMAFVAAPDVIISLAGLP